MLYNENMNSDSSARPYRKAERARQEQETRLRITEAAVELHRTVGPANTTMTELAELAGVSRATVYNHFPSEFELFMACSTHWATQNPFPDPSRWGAIEAPSERLVSALEELYRWYRLKEDMLGNVFRDTPVVPPLAEVMGQLWSTYEAAMVQTLASGWVAGKGEMEELEAMLRLVLDFNTWRVLTDAGLSHGRAAVLAARMVIGVVGA